MSTIEESALALHVPRQREAYQPVARPRGRLRWQRRYIGGVVAVDAASAAVAVGLLVGWRLIRGRSALGSLDLDISVALLPMAWVLTLCLVHCYDMRILGVGSEEFRRVARAAMGLSAVTGFIDYATDLSIGRRFVLGAVPITGAVSVVGRYAARKWLHHMRAHGRCRQRVVVVGHVSQTADLIERLEKEQYHGMDVVGACLPPEQLELARAVLSVPVLGPFDDVTGTVAAVAADTVAVTASGELAGSALRQIAWQLEATGTDLVVAPGLIEVAGPRLHIRPVTGLPLLQVEHPRLSGGRKLLKGLVDRMFALAMVVVLLPVFAAVGVAIRTTSRGPVIFRQRRVGLNGSTFTLYKFRTMVENADRMRTELDELNIHRDEVLFKIPSDPRVTPVGRWLRRYSIDELPQLFNVLLGRMSLVGPRPPLPDEVARYADSARRRLLVKPGLTGLWQISGRSDLDWEESVRLDLRYVENWSLALDLMIIWKTAFAVLRGEGAY